MTETLATEALVIGGGLAGASVAIQLARAGREVMLLERERGAHDKVCGEFLSYEACGYLRALGLDLSALGGVEVDTLRIFAGGDGSLSRLPFRACSLSRRVLDEALLRTAAEAGADVRRGVRATGLERTDLGQGGQGWTVANDAGEVITARHVFLATGKHDLRGYRRPGGLQGDLIGFKQHWTLAPDQAAILAGCVELHLFAGGYAGLEPVEGGAANLCLLIRRRAFADLGRSWPDVLAMLRTKLAVLGRRLEGAQARQGRPLAISAIPYGYIRRGGRDGLWRLGDQAAVIPSFAGEGMSIALHSAALAARLHLAGASADVFQRRLARDVGRQVLEATLISQALVRPWTHGLIAQVGRTAPRVLAAVAGATRIPSSALALA